MSRNQKVPGEPSRLVAEARKRGKPNRVQNVAAAHASSAASANPIAAHHDAAAAQQSWESNMARIEAGLRQVENEFLLMHCPPYLWQLYGYVP